MYILMTDNKDLIMTKRETIYQYENRVNDIKFLIPQKYNNIDLRDMSCVVFAKVIPENDESYGLYKFVKYDEESYKDKLTVTIPITISLTKKKGKINFWLMFMNRNVEESRYQDKILKTNLATLDVNESQDANSKEDIDEVWEHISVEELQKKVDDLANSLKSKADNIEISEDKIQLTSNGEVVGEPILLTDLNEANEDATGGELFTTLEL